MIAKLSDTSDIDTLMEIWLETNKSAHSFIAKSYWNDNYSLVKHLLPTADIYTYIHKSKIAGFIGIADKGYIAGLFVRAEQQGKGIGTHLLNHCKALYPRLALDVYADNQQAVNFYLKNDFTILLSQVDTATNSKEYCMQWDRGQRYE